MKNTVRPVDARAHEGLGLFACLGRAGAPAVKNAVPGHPVQPSYPLKPHAAPSARAVLRLRLGGIRI